MAMRVLRNIIVLLLVSSVVFLAFRYISFLRGNIAKLEGQKQDLIQELDRRNTLVGQLNAKNKGLKNYLKATHKRLNKSFVDLEEAELKNEKLKSQFALLKAENNALLDEKIKVTQENESMKVKLSSIDELKKAMRALKRKVATPEGNRGFLVKDGQPTSVPKVKIEVTPASDK